MHNTTTNVVTAGGSNNPNPNGKWWKNPLCAIFVGCVYVFIPTDIIPDVFPVVGWLDDCGVIFFVVRTVLTSLKNKNAIDI